MTGRVLVVDDLEANRRLLEALLLRDYCDVSFAANGEEALQNARLTRPEIILLDWKLPDLDGLEVCRRLKADPATRDIPLVMVTAAADAAIRVRAAQAGADDFLTKPINALQLSARVRGLLRLKRSVDELRRRQLPGRGGPLVEQAEVAELRAEVAIHAERPNGAVELKAALSPHHGVQVWDSEALLGGAADHADVLLVDLSATAIDPLLVVARLQAREASRGVHILCLDCAQHQERAARALDLGAHDLLAWPTDPEELALRVSALVGRKRKLDAMQALIDDSIQQAITDALTGLYNRRYVETQLAALLKRAAFGGPSVALALLDLDHFKQINDRFGHEAGDAVLKEFAARVSALIRPTDFACRLGGEEFVILLPGASLDYAVVAAERLRLAVAGEPFYIAEGVAISVTVSAGVASTAAEPATVEAMLRAADERLYAAKAAGRNRVAA